MKMKIKKATKIVTIISIVIIILGIIAGIGISNSIESSIPTDSMYVDGSDFSGIIQIFGFFGSKILGTLVTFGGFIIASLIWVIYGFVLLIITIVNKLKNNETKN